MSAVDAFADRVARTRYALAGAAARVAHLHTVAVTGAEREAFWEALGDLRVALNELLDADHDHFKACEAIGWAAAEGEGREDAPHMPDTPA